MLKDDFQQGDKLPDHRWFNAVAKICNETTMTEMITEMRKQTEILQAILQAVNVSPETRSHAPSESNAAEVSAEPCSTTPTSDCTPGHSASLPELSPANPSAASCLTEDRLVQNAKERVSDPAHPLEQSFWGTVLETSRSATREEFHKIAVDLLLALRQKSISIGYTNPQCNAMFVQHFAMFVQHFVNPTISRKKEARRPAKPSSVIDI